MKTKKTTGLKGNKITVLTPESKKDIEKVMKRGVPDEGHIQRNLQNKEENNGSNTRT